MANLLHYARWPFRTSSLKHKLFILLVFISIVPIVLVYYSSQYFMFRSSTEFSAKVSSQYVQFISSDLTRYLQDLGRLLDPLVTNPDFQKYLYLEKDDYISQAKYSLGFRQIIQSTLQSREELIGVLYLDRKEKVYFESYPAGLKPQYPFFTQSFYANIQAISEPTLYVPHATTYTIGPAENALSYVKPVIDLHTGEIVSWILIEIKATFIKSMLHSSQQESSSQLILYHSPDGIVISDRSFEPNLIRNLGESLKPGLTSGQKIFFRSGKERYEAIYETISYGDWKLVWFAPLSSLSEGIRHSLRLTFYIALTSLVTALFIAYPAMSKALRPMYQLMKGMKRVGRGTYVPMKVHSGNDEIGSLIRSYNLMLSDLQVMEQEVYQSKLKEKERELLQLQAQINPHFLFNTLETIESYALKSNEDAVGDMVQSVSRIMRYNVRNDGGYAPLSEELAYIQPLALH